MKVSDTLESLADVGKLKQLDLIVPEWTMGTIEKAQLQGVTEADAQLLDQALGIKTVEAMGTNKFFLWAQALVTLAAQEK